MKKSLTGAALAAATLFAMGPAATADEAPTTTGGASETTPLERVSAYTQPSVVYIDITWTGYVYDTFNKMYLNNAEPLELSFQCTGYVVNPDGYIATAGHCVDPAEVNPAFVQAAAQWALENGYYAATDLSLEQVIGFGDYVIRNSDGKRGPERVVTTAWSQSAGGVETGKALPARVVKWQKFDQGDGAMLKVQAENLNALPLSDEDVEIGTEIVSVGYPGSVDLVADKTFTPSYKEGAVSSVKTVSNGLLSVYEISAAVSGGMSGGPTVNLDGEVVGFNSFGINSEIETQPFNFVRPADTVRELLGDAGAEPGLSEDAQAYREGLDAYFAGDKNTAVEKLGAVVKSQPTHELAKKYLDRAEKLPDPPKKEKDDSGRGTGLLIGIGGGVVALVLVGLGLALLLRGKKGGVSAPAYPPVQGPAPAARVAPAAPAGPPPGFTAPVPAGVGAGVPERTDSTAMASPAHVGAAPAAATAQIGPAGSSVSLPEQRPASDAEQEHLFCSQCGTKGAAGQRFCRHCGSEL
jgi:S1-C subfamily serine protease